MRGIRYSWVMTVLAIVGMVATVGRAEVSTTGDTYDDGWNFRAGYNANTTGGFTIDGGSFFSRRGSLGYATGSTGTAVITGTGSTWSNSELFVGVAGSGMLRVEAGGQVSSSAQGILGLFSGSMGEATVTGTGSKWTSSGSLYVGESGSGKLTVSDGGMVSARTLYASLSDLYGDGTITASGVVLDADLSFDATHDLTQTLTFGSGGTLQFTLRSIVDGGSDLGVGYKHSGSLRITEGRSVYSNMGYLGCNSGSTGTAVVSGLGSTWSNSSLIVGGSGSGTLRVEAGGQVSSGAVSLGDSSDCTGEAIAIITGAGSKWTISGGDFSDLYVGGTLRVEAGGHVSNSYGYLGPRSGSTGKAIVTGAGSKWNNFSELYVGVSGSGTLTVSDGGQVTAEGLYINSQSTVRLHVSSDRMLVLGNASAIGDLGNRGTLSLLADAFLPGGIYRPIGEYADRALTWSGGGSTLAVGGVWDRDAGTFTVGESVRANAGTAAEVASGMRLLVSDVASGDRAGVSFGALTSGTTLRGLPLTQEEGAELMPMLGSEEKVLSGWEFEGQLAGGEALVSFDIGLGAKDVRLWRRAGGGWSEYTPEMLTYDSNGIVSFTVDPASLNSGGYAVSGVVPEPGAVAVVGLAAGMLLNRRRVRRGRVVRTAAGARVGRK